MTRDELSAMMAVESQKMYGVYLADYYTDYLLCVSKNGCRYVHHDELSKVKINNETGEVENIKLGGGRNG